MLACSEVTRLYASDEIQRVSVTKRLKVRLHLLMCRFCRRYVRELAAIGNAARRLLGQDPRGTEAHDTAFEQRVVGQVAGEIERGEQETGSRQ